MGKFDDIGVSLGDIKSVDDLSKLPFTVKSDFRENYPFGLFSVPQKQRENLFLTKPALISWVLHNGPLPGIGNHGLVTDLPLHYHSLVVRRHQVHSSVLHPFRRINRLYF